MSGQRFLCYWNKKSSSPGWEFRRRINSPPFVKQLFAENPNKKPRKQGQSAVNKARKTNNDLQNLECTGFIGKNTRSYQRNEQDWNVFCLTETKKKDHSMQC